MVTVKVEFSRRTRKRGTEGIHDAIASIPLLTAASSARAIRGRVQQRGETAQHFSGYSSSKRGYWIAERYKNKPSGGKPTVTGAVLYDSSRDYHTKAGVKLGSFSVTGGLWEGITALDYGSRFARVAFRGRSQGQGPNWRKSKSGKTRGRGKKVSNALKAYSVLKATNINILAYKDSELEDMARGITQKLTNGITYDFYTGIEWPKSINQGVIGEGILKSLTGELMSNN